MSRRSEVDTVTEDGEVVTGGLQILGNSAVGQIVRAEIDAQIATAKLYPRNYKAVSSKIVMLATLDPETAQECLYALVRGSKKKRAGSDAQDEQNNAIEGPSIRLAEIAFQQYGNCRAEARVIEVDRVNKVVVAEGVFHDLETNSASKATVRRRISTSSGYLFSEDMIVVTGNAACSIAKRNAILAGIPRGLYREAYNAAREIVAGKAEALGVNRDKAIKAFAVYGIKPEQIIEALGVTSEVDITRDHIVTLRGMFATLKNGEETVESMFGKRTVEHVKVADPLADAKPTQTAKPAQATAAQDSGSTGNPPAEAQGDAAYDAGYAAFRAGQTIDNIEPAYANNPTLLEAWNDGFKMAKAEASKKADENTFPGDR
jgi:hypothetical protein